MTHQRTVTAHAAEQTIAFSRDFDASVDRVFAAHTDPGLVARWTGPRGTRVEIRDFDARTGGRWSYLVRGEQGEWGFFGSFHEVSPPHRIVQTFEFEGAPGHPTLEVLAFTPLDETHSRIEGLSVFLSPADRDAMLAEMDSGMDENFLRLDRLLADAEDRRVSPVR